MRHDPVRPSQGSDVARAAGTPLALDGAEALPGAGARVNRSPSSDAISSTRPATRRDSTAGFAGIRLPASFDPRQLLAELHALPIACSYERPDRDLVLVAVGEAGRVEGSADDGAQSVRSQIEMLLDASGSTDRAIETPELRPRLLGGFAFRDDRVPQAPWEGFPSGLLVLPRMLFVRDSGVCGVVLAPGVPRTEAEAVLAALPTSIVRHGTNGHESSAQPRPDGFNGTRPNGAHPGPPRVARDLDRAGWLSAVATVATDVRSGLYEKAVLASIIELEAERPFEVGAALTRLRDDYPHCHLFTMTIDGGTFFGASPELLVERRAGIVTALGLAGSAARSDDPDEDRRLGLRLLGSAKDRIEHEIVVRALREGLSDVTEDLRAPNQPKLQQLRHIQHLATEVEGRARPGVDVLELVARLHPTPAVCGWPTAAARKVIDAHETFDRGWYAGPVGWVDGNGDGEFAVALRSALVRAERAWLFAGAGIMGESRPEDELAEIELKFRPLAGALADAAMHEANTSAT